MKPSFSRFSSSSFLSSQAILRILSSTTLPEGGLKGHFPSNICIWPSYCVVLKHFEVLFLSSSSSLCPTPWFTYELGSYRSIPTNPNREKWALTETQMEYVRQSSLSHLTQMGEIRGLVERWHLQAETFHFPSDEAIIILEDVACIYGLPINGPIVIERRFSSSIVYEVEKCYRARFIARLRPNAQLYGI